MNNREFAKQPWFIKLCDEADVKATKRQASKYKLLKGRAYKCKERN